jgi:hypothetical protein
VSHHSDVSTIRSRFAERLSASSLEMLPFPHLVVSDVLPDDVYSAVLADNPFGRQAGAAFADPSWASRLTFETAYDKRFHIDLALEAGEPTGSVWENIGAAFGDTRWLGQVLRERFPDYFSLRFGDIDAIDGFWQRMFSKVFIQRHEPGFALEAHTDLPTRVATCIFSFAASTGHEHCGTQLLTPVDPLWRCWGNAHHPIDGFKVAKVAPYAPNTCLVFFKTRHSWHSVAPDAVDAPDGRFGMQVQLYERDGGALVDLSEPDLVTNRQLKPVAGAELAVNRARRLVVATRQGQLRATISDGITRRRDRA